MTPRIEAALPFWLDRPDEEAVDIAVEARRAGLARLWVGEMATFDAVALATAIGHRAPGLALTIGPLAVGVRSPVALAMAVSSVAALTESDVALALGASSPAIVTGWHEREWGRAATRTAEAIATLRTIFAGERAHGFRVRTPRPDTRIVVAAFGPAMTRVAARQADEVVLNLVPPAHVRRVREALDGHAADAGRPAPRLAVWLPAALDPGEAALSQLAAQLAVYLAPPGYGELFSSLGFGELVSAARGGARRAELAATIPRELLAEVCALGSEGELRARIAEYGAAGADSVAVVPSTAEDPAGARTLAAVA